MNAENIISDDLWSASETLVKTRITGTRKGQPDVQNSVHSFDVRDLLRKNGFSDQICLAGLLHDVIEDGGVTINDLRAIGVPEYVITLVDLCSHNTEISNGDERWIVMIGRLVEAKNPDAWAIKLADIIDNMEDAWSMPPDRQKFLREVKAELIWRVTQDMDERINKLRSLLKDEIAKSVS